MEYLKDLCTALNQCITCWFHSREVIERRKQFVNDAVSEEIKTQLPYKILMKVWNKKLKNYAQNSD